MPVSLKPYFLSFAVYFLMACLPVIAQRKTLSGIIKDVQSEERVPFASIAFKNSTVGKLADSSGYFSFNLNSWPSDTVVITCVGYQPFFLLINTDKDSVFTDILMERGTFDEGV